MRLQLRSSFRGSFCCLAYCGLLFGFWHGSFFGSCAVRLGEAGLLFGGDEYSFWLPGGVGGGDDGFGLRSGVAGSVAAGEVEGVGGVVAGEKAAGVGACDGGDLGDLFWGAVSDDLAAA